MQYSLNEIIEKSKPNSGDCFICADCKRSLNREKTRFFHNPKIRIAIDPLCETCYDQKEPTPTYRPLV